MFALDTLQTSCGCDLIIHLYFQISEFETINGHYSMPEALNRPVEPAVVDGGKSNGTSASGECSFFHN